MYGEGKPIMTGQQSTDELTPKIDFVASKKQRAHTANDFGARLLAARKAKGLTQAELAEAIGTSQRMIAYYETQGGTPNAPLLLKLGKVLSVDPNELLGVTKKKADAPEDLRLWRKLRQVESLPPDQRQTVVRMIDALVSHQTVTKKKQRG
jgi:transcriptional regulator with XRE-family HTH domain